MIPKTAKAVSKCSRSILVSNPRQSLLVCVQQNEVRVCHVQQLTKKLKLPAKREEYFSQKFDTPLLRIERAALKDTPRNKALTKGLY